MSDSIELFMERYKKEYDYYLNLSKEVEFILKEKLDFMGVRAIVSSRAKSPTRLHDKIIDRNKRIKYQGVDDIYKDIVDLAGVRVALYFPADISVVSNIIHSEFNLDGKEKEFPEEKEIDKTKKGYKKVFSGYSAKHFRVKIKEGSNSRYANTHSVEIQVASVLMHAWSEVEHDLVYKPLQGNLSHEEFMILDEINGLVLSGNLALERLQLAGIKRTENDEYEFENHYDLASFFISNMKEINIDGVDFNGIFKVLKFINKTKRFELINVINWVKSHPLNNENTSGSLPVPPDNNIASVVSSIFFGFNRLVLMPGKIYDNIIVGVVNSFPEDVVTALENFDKHLYEGVKIKESVISSLKRLVFHYYLNLGGLEKTLSFVSDYDAANSLGFEKSEDVLQHVVAEKNISLLKKDSEVIALLNNLVELKNDLIMGVFSKELLGKLVIEIGRLDKIISYSKAD